MKKTLHRYFHPLPFVIASLFFLANPSPGAPVRPISALESWDWVNDTLKLRERLTLAGKWGYNTFICQFSSPPRMNSDLKFNWSRLLPSGQWQLSDADADDKVNARGHLVSKVQILRRISESCGLRFVPEFGPFGWGGGLPSVDSGTLSTGYYKMTIPEKTVNLLPGPGRATSFIHPMDGIGDSGGAAIYPTHGIQEPAVRIRLSHRGVYWARYEIRPIQDAYLKCRLTVTLSDAVRDSCALDLHGFNGHLHHPLSTPLIAKAGSRKSELGTELDLDFFVQKGKTYILKLEYHAKAPRGGWLEATGTMMQDKPPRNLLVNTENWNVRKPDAHTRISSLRPKLMDVAYFFLNRERADSAWASMRAFRGSFLDLPLNSYRQSVDPTAPATRSIFLAMTDAIAEGMGGKPVFYHLSGDEVFGLKRSFRQSQFPYDTLDRSRFFSRIIKQRMREVDSIYSKRYPDEKQEITFLLYGDMLCEFNGFSEGTIEAARWLAPSRIFPRKLVLMPWFYDGHFKYFEEFYEMLGAPPGNSMDRWAWTVRKQVRRLTVEGHEFIGLYSTADGSSNLENELQGARIWNEICADLPTRCRGVGFYTWVSGPKGDWARGYNGLPALAAGWIPRSSSPSTAPNIRLEDRDGNGVVDTLERAQENRR